MPDKSIDPASLTGEDLVKWFQRSPAEVERERQAAAAKRYQTFFYGSQTPTRGRVPSRGVTAAS